MSRHRDLFPLPHFDAIKVDNSRKLSHSVLRRVRSRAHKVDWMNEAVDTLNRLGGTKVLSRFT